MTLDDATPAGAGDEIRVHPLGEPEPIDDAGLAGFDAQLLDAVDEDADRPLSEEESKELIAGMLEMPFAAAGWWLGRPHPERLRDAIEATWQLPPPTARRLAGSAWMAMPRTWRESRLLERLPIVLFAGQLTAVMRLRLAATQHLVASYQENPHAFRTPDGTPEPVSAGGGPAPRGPDHAGSGDAPAARANGSADAAPVAGLGRGAPISRRAAERRERRRADAAARDAVGPN